MERIYLDYAACHPLFSEVKETLIAFVNEGIWNPSSTYFEGRLSRDQIDLTREITSNALGCLFGEVLFCSSGTEAVNMALIGTALAYQDSSRKTILVSAFEHPCVLETIKTLNSLGYKVELIPVTPNGIIDLEFLKNRLDGTILLVSVMHANNELGTIQPINEIALLARQKECLIHTDAAQTFLNPCSPNQINWKIKDLDADLVSISGHKIGALPGVGALYVRSGIKIDPLIRGGGQERDMRGGTENLLGIISLREAIKIFSKQKNIWENKTVLRNLFLKTLTEHSIVEPCLTVPNLENTLPGHLHLTFSGISADSFLIRLDHRGICASSGSACSSGSLEPSHVLKAIGYSSERAMQGIRFTFGSFCKEQEITEAGLRICNLFKEMAPNQQKYR